MNHLKLPLICILLISLAACSTLEPGATEQALAPESLVRPKSEQRRQPADIEYGPEQAGPDRADADSVDVLEEIEEDTRRFNERLQAIAGRLASSKTEQAVIRPLGDDGEKMDISFDFFQADIVDVIRLFMEILDYDYSIPPGSAKGMVSLHVEDEYTRQEVFDLLMGILRLNSLTAIQDDQGIWQIVPLTMAPNIIPAENLLVPGEEGTRKRGQVLQGFKLRFISTAEMAEIIKPYLTNGAMVYGSDQRGIFLVLDYPHVQAKVDKLIDLFDVSVFADKLVKVYSLKYVLASDLVKELDAVVQATGLAELKGPESLSFLAMERLNKLMIITGSEEIFAFVDAWIEELDSTLPQVLREEQQENIFVYYVQNGDASEIISALEGIFKGAAPQRQQAQPRQEEQVPIGRQVAEQRQEIIEQEVAERDLPGEPPTIAREEPPQLKLEPQDIGPITGELTGDVTFVVDETTNSILIRCLGSDYPKIESLIKKLDIYPKQVLIEVVIADVSLDEARRLGVEWSVNPQLDDGTAQISSDTGLGTVGGGDALIGSGLALLYNTDRVKAAVRALEDNNKARVLSSPTIMASNHKEASINVGDEVPVVTSTLRTVEGNQQTTDTTIQYRDVGIILNVTPHINEKGLVRMELSQEVSEISNRTVAGVNSPVFQQRTAKSSIVVDDQQTIIIGGLIRQSHSEGSSGIPWLSRVPVLKYLFSSQVNEFRATELMIFITPHVVQSKDDATFISEGFLDRLEEIKASILY